MTIFLQPEVKSGLGDDTFWLWFAREFSDSTFDLPADGYLRSTDIVLQYSTLGPCRARGGIHVALCFELHPEMIARGIAGDWSGPLAKIEACAAAADRRVIASELMRPYYSKFGSLDCLPIGVDTNLFRRRPHAERIMLRERYGIPQDSQVGFWCGTNHPMKGFGRLKEYVAAGRKSLVEFGVAGRDVVWIIVWKSKRESARGQIGGAHEFVGVPQEQLAELMNCADFMLSTSRLRPFYMVEWEAMAADLPIVNAGEKDKDFPAPSSCSRIEVFNRKWDRGQAKEVWRKYLDGLIAERAAA